ncbi:hypothetical protein [Klebsiella phage vB_KshKPC-M]|nr:hypothetical protein [Klebsiella phage vB_KshKPC-M]
MQKKTFDGLRFVYSSSRKAKYTNRSFSDDYEIRCIRTECNEGRNAGHGRRRRKTGCLRYLDCEADDSITESPVRAGIPADQRTRAFPGNYRDLADRPPLRVARIRWRNFCENYRRLHRRPADRGSDGEREVRESFPPGECVVYFHRRNKNWCGAGFQPERSQGNSGPRRSRDARKGSGVQRLRSSRHRERFRPSEHEPHDRQRQMGQGCSSGGKGIRRSGRPAKHDRRNYAGPPSRDQHRYSSVEASSSDEKDAGHKRRLLSDLVHQEPPEHHHYGDGGTGRYRRRRHQRRAGIRKRPNEHEHRDPRAVQHAADAAERPAFQSSLHLQMHWSHRVPPADNCDPYRDLIKKRLRALFYCIAFYNVL